MVADVHDAQPAEALEERKGEATADFGAICARDADFDPGIRVSDPVSTDFTPSDGLYNGIISHCFPGKLEHPSKGKATSNAPKLDAGRRHVSKIG